MKKVCKINAVISIVLLVMFLMGMYLIVSSTHMSESGAYDLLSQVETNDGGISTEKLYIVMENLAHQQILLGAVLAIISGIGLIVCMHWLFIYLKSKEK